MRRTRVSAAIFVAFMFVTIEGAGPAAAQPAGSPHVPDLVTVAPSSFRISQGAKGSGVRRLYFSNTIGNQGHGPLELRAQNNAATGTTDAFQQIYTHTGTSSIKSRLTLLSESLVGTFVFHAAHSHWHMSDFAQYDLRAINPDGSTGAVLRSTDKVSFCMLDTDNLFPGIEHHGMGLSHGCGQTARQGLRVGMGDTYSSALPDQYIDIVGVANGTYRVVSTADANSAEHPDGQLIELNDHNNTASIDIVINNASVSVVPGSARTGIDQPASTPADVQTRSASAAARGPAFACLLPG